MLVISVVLIIFLKVFSSLISEKVTLMREELSSYECGFEHHKLSRVPFSLRYFYLTLIFLLFDLEIVLMLFYPSFLISQFSYFSLCILLAFIAILFLSLVYE